MHQRFRAATCFTLCAVLFLGTAQVANADAPVKGLETTKTYQISNTAVADMIEQKVAVTQQITADVAGLVKASAAVEALVGTDIAHTALAQVEDYVNVRSAASESSEAVGKLYDDAVAAVLGEENGWLKIRSGSVEGYVKSEFVIVGDEEAILSAAKTVATVKTTTLNVRSEAATDASIVTQVGEDADLTVVAQDIEGWVQVSTEEGEGYVASEYVEVSTKFKTALSKAEEEVERMKTAAGKGQAVANYACQFIGNPYVYGGTSLTNGADCSGFVMSVYAHYGVYMSHSSSAQRSVGKSVSLSEIRPGDIVCYSGHVGIYVGNNTIVHASNEKDGIKLSSPVNYRKIVTIRRVFY
ncbi:MAG: C40 family peptidase [Eubacterium sp.]|nr:C40 family peptidase [Eubacterium sp.]